MGKYLVVGYGSIGKRHSSILCDLGHTVVSVDPSPLAGADYKPRNTGLWSRSLGDSVFVSWTNEKSMYENGIRIGDFDGLLDCTPPNVRSGWRISSMPHFVEKPLGSSYPTTSDAPIMMGFVYRWLPSLQQFRESLMGVRVFSLTMLAGAWLPDWHLGEDYRERYHGTLGVGGIINDSLSHSIFIARWLMGELELVGAVTGRLGGLDISTEDTAAVLLRAATGQPVYVLADYLRKPGDSTIEAVTSGGVKVWEMNPDNADVMYRAQMSCFAEICEGKRQWGYPSLVDGVAVQMLMEEVRGG